MRRVTQICSLAIWVNAASAYTPFDTTCSLPADDTPVNFVSSPDTRGTLDILWSCLFTIIACTWTIQHLNVPAQRQDCCEKGAKHGFWCNFKYGARQAWTSFGWMIVTVLAPEVILGKAVTDLISALDSRNKMKEFAAADGVEWTLTHGFFADMGGFMAFGVDSGGEEATAQDQHGHASTLGSDGNVTATANASTKTPQSEVARHQQQATPVTALDLFRLRSGHRGIFALTRLPDVTEAEIRDKSKSSFFVKAIVVVQVLWFTLQVIVRAARGLAISQLELAVTAFAACAVVIYVVIFQKPQGVQSPMRPFACDQSALKEVVQIWDRTYMRGLFNIGLGDEYSTMLPNDGINRGSDRSVGGILLSGLILGSVVFGSVHIGAWNFTFPSRIELILWRISSVMVTGLLPVAYIPTKMLGVWAADIYDELEWMSKVWVVSFQILYVAARLFLLVEIFRTLLFLPKDAFVATWASNIPHIGG